jgi:hypothetical protein
LPLYPAHYIASSKANHTSESYTEAMDCCRVPIAPVNNRVSMLDRTFGARFELLRRVMDVDSRQTRLASQPR